MITAKELAQNHPMSQSETERYIAYVSKYIPTNCMYDLVLNFVAELCDNGFTEHHVMCILEGIVQGTTKYRNGKVY